MIKKKDINRILSAILFISGLFLLINPQLNVTGAFLGVPESTANFFSSLIGTIFIVLGIVLSTTTHSGLEIITLSSAIKKHQPILRLTKAAIRDQTVERELNHLIKELSKGNFEAGLGQPGHIEGTDIFYLRGRNGGRLYYHQIADDNYEIVAKSAKGRNQDQVISKIKGIYGH